MKCERWGTGDKQCLMPAQHLGPCVIKSGTTLPVYHGRVTDGCADCGVPVAQPWALYCVEHLAARFGGEE